MSFSSSIRGGYSSSALISNGNDGDSNYIRDSRRIQANIQSIIFTTKQIYTLFEMGDPQGWENGKHQNELHNMILKAKGVAVETSTLLNRFHDLIGGSTTEKNQRRLMHQKLSENYRLALKGLEKAANSHLHYRVHDRSENNRRSSLSTSADASVISHRASTDESSVSVYSSEGDLMNANAANPFAYGADRYSHDTMYRSTREVKSSAAYAYGQDDQSCYSKPDSEGYHTRLVEQRHMMPVAVNSGDLEEQMYKERTEGIDQIKNDILGIHNLYKELAVHVNNQAGDIDNIESQIRETASHTVDATAQVAVARRNQSYRTKRMCFLTSVLIIGAIVVLVLLDKMFHWNIL